MTAWLIAALAATAAGAEVTIPLPGGRTCSAPMLPPSASTGALITHFYAGAGFDWSRYGARPRCLVGAGGAVTLIPSGALALGPGEAATSRNDPSKPRFVMIPVGSTYDVVYWPAGYVSKGTPGYKYWTDTRGYTPGNAMRDLEYSCAGLACYWRATTPFANPDLPGGYSAAGPWPDSRGRTQLEAWAAAGFPDRDVSGCMLTTSGSYITWNGKLDCRGQQGWTPPGPGATGTGSTGSGSGSGAPAACEWTYSQVCFHEDTPGVPGSGTVAPITVAAASGTCLQGLGGFQHFRDGIYWRQDGPAGPPESCRGDVLRHSELDGYAGPQGRLTPPAAPGHKPAD